MDTLETLEEIWGEYQVYSGDELNPVSGAFTVGKGEDLSAKSKREGVFGEDKGRTESDTDKDKRKAGLDG